MSSLETSAVTSVDVPAEATAPSRVPSFEGRPLPKPHEQPFDQGLQFDLQTLLGRRTALKAVGLGALSVGLAACSPSATPNTTPTTTPATTTTSATSTAASTSSVSAGDVTAAATEIPDETAGPYPGDGSNGADVLEQSGVVRRDITSSFGSSTTTAQGVPMTLTLKITDLANGNRAFAGVAVYVWHCDREGRYSMYSDGVTGENYLRGVQVADGQGEVSFTSIFPACYSGRWPHIHFEVYPDEASITDSTNAIATSQVALPKPVCDTVYATAGYEASVPNLAQLSLATDNVFGDDGGQSQLATVTGDATSGYTVTLAAAVDTATTPTGGGAPGGPGGGGPGGGPGGGGGPAGTPTS